MSLVKCACPRCNHPLQAPVPGEVPAKVKCSRCSAKFLLTPQGETVLISPKAPAPLREGPAPHFPTAAPAAPPPPGRASSNIPLLLGLIGGGVIVVGAAVVGLVLALSNNTKEEKPAATGEPKTTEEQPLAQREDAEPPDEKPAPVKQQENPAPVPPPAPPPPRESPRVNRAIDKGVEYLRASLLGKHPPVGMDRRLGAKALAGLTLLSCGVPPGDPAVVRVAEEVRARCPRLAATYEIAISIWFLDKLNDPQDRKLLQSLALRLIAGQQINGGWDYISQPLSERQENQLRGVLRDQDQVEPVPQENPGTVKGKAGRAAKRNPRRPAARNRALPANLKDLPVFRFEPGKPFRIQPSSRHEDNSLTQFAILALWAGQKHGVPAGRSLTMAAARFRATQNPNGTWGYLAPGRAGYPSMTCAGLLGLAVGRGASKGGELGEVNHPSPEKGSASQTLVRDPAVKKALAYLHRQMGPPAPGRVAKRSNSNLYFLWSLERVAVVYSLQKIGDRDWYAWGSNIILDGQRPDGSWRGTYPGLVDTSFALLFLKRVNVVQDLTNKLQLDIVKPPGGKVEGRPRDNNELSGPEPR